MQILAIDKLTKGTTEEKMRRHLPKELAHTIQLYLDEKIRTFFFRKDRPGVVFIMESDSLDEAQRVINELPLVKEKLLDFELVPIGPLKPLEILLTAPGAYIKIS